MCVFLIPHCLYIPWFFTLTFFPQRQSPLPSLSALGCALWLVLTIEVTADLRQELHSWEGSRTTSRSWERTQSGSAWRMKDTWTSYPRWCTNMWARSRGLHTCVCEMLSLSVTQWELTITNLTVLPQTRNLLILLLPLPAFPWGKIPRGFIGWHLLEHVVLVTSFPRWSACLEWFSSDFCLPDLPREDDNHKHWQDGLGSQMSLHGRDGPGHLSLSAHTCSNLSFPIWKMWTTTSHKACTNSTKE